jgi:hypothetical protein
MHRIVKGKEKTCTHLLGGSCAGLGGHSCNHTIAISNHNVACWIRQRDRSYLYVRA